MGFAFAFFPSLYRGKVGLDVAEAQHLMDGLDWQGAIKDLRASVEWLKADGSKKVFLCPYVVRIEIDLFLKCPVKYTTLVYVDFF